MHSEDFTHDRGRGRVVEYYGEVVELSAALVSREAGGWSVLSAGQVAPGKYLAEYGRAGCRNGLATPTYLVRNVPWQKGTDSTAPRRRPSSTQVQPVPPPTARWPE